RGRRRGVRALDARLLRRARPRRAVLSQPCQPRGSGARRRRLRRRPLPPARRPEATPRPGGTPPAGARDSRDGSDRGGVLKVMRALLVLAATALAAVAAGSAGAATVDCGLYRLGPGARVAGATHGPDCP